MDAAAYASWGRNSRLLAALGCPEGSTAPGLARLQKLNPANRAAVFLGPPPPDFSRPTQSGIAERMEEFINCPSTDIAFKSATTFKAMEDGRGALAVVREECDGIASSVWASRLTAIESIARGDNVLTAHESVALALWTNNSSLFHKVNTAVLGQQLSPAIERFANCLYSALHRLPPYVGEVFIGSSRAQRKLYTVGTEFAWQHFVSASTLWKVSTNRLIDDFILWATLSRNTLFFFDLKISFFGSRLGCPRECTEFHDSGSKRRRLYREIVDWTDCWLGRSVCL